MLKFLIILFNCLIICVSDSYNEIIPEKREIYNIYEYEMTLDQGINNTVYYHNEKCYTSWVEHYKKKGIYYLHSEYFNAEFIIASIEKSSNSIIYTVSKRDSSHLYSIREHTTFDKKYYLTIIPIRFNHLSAIDESGIIISKEKVCKIQ